MKTFFGTSFAAFFGILFFILMFHDPPAKGIIFLCKFYYDNEHGYTCNVMENSLRFNMHSYDVSFSGSKSFRKSVKFVRFDNSIIDFVPKQLFEFFENLERLEITNSTLAKLDQHSFADGIHLKALQLQNNNIQSIDSKTFQNLNNLDYLNLENNQIEYLNGDLFKQNLQLQYVNLRNNIINYIDHNLVNSLKSLKSVDFSGNDCVQKSFEKDPNLESATIEKDLNLCFSNAKNETLRQRLHESEVRLNKKVQNLIAENELPEEQKYFMNSLAIEFGLTVVLFIYVIKSLWDKLLRSSKNPRKEE